MHDVANPSLQLVEQHGLLGNDLLFTYSFRRSGFMADIAARWVWGSIFPHRPEPDDEILKSPEEHGTHNPVELDGQEVNLQLSPPLRPEDDSDYQPSSSKMAPSNIQDISNLNGDSIMFNALPTKSNDESKMMVGIGSPTKISDCSLFHSPNMSDDSGSWRLRTLAGR